jgi:hypothetical protein
MEYVDPLPQFALLLTQYYIATFRIEGIQDIGWNHDPFDSLVLPDGYKDLILAFVESQLRQGDTFDDVINGKGKSAPTSPGPRTWSAY